MDPLADFLGRLLMEVRFIFPSRPGTEEPADPQAAAVLERAYRRDRLDLAGPAIEFDRPVALAAAELVRQACWALVNRDDRVEDLERRLTMARGPTRPSHHVS